jgi:hypothetical protein
MIDHKIDIVTHMVLGPTLMFLGSKEIRLPIIYTVHGWSFHQNQNQWLKC